MNLWTLFRKTQCSAKKLIQFTRTLFTLNLCTISLNQLTTNQFLNMLKQDHNLLNLVGRSTALEESLRAHNKGRVCHQLIGQANILKISSL